MERTEDEESPLIKPSTKTPVDDIYGIYQDHSSSAKYCLVMIVASGYTSIIHN